MPNIAPDAISGNELIGGAAICPTRDKTDRKPKTEFLIVVGKSSTPYKKTIMKDMKKKQLQMQAMTTRNQFMCNGMQITTIIKRPDKKVVPIKKVRRFNIFNKKNAAIVPGISSAPDIATFAWMFPLILPIYCDTP